MLTIPVLFDFSSSLMWLARLSYYAILSVFGALTVWLVVYTYLESEVSPFYIDERWVSQYSHPVVQIIFLTNASN